MNTQNYARTTFVLDRSTASDLTYLSRRMGRSRSDLVREILAPSIAELAGLVRCLPDQPGPDDVERFRRGAVVLIGDAYQHGLVALDASKGGES